MAEIETDYLVIGAGAGGMAFVDALIADTDVDVVMVDRRHNPGGHWNDAYPFVRLHQPSATYGVGSRPLGTETIDTTGPNAGFYERATGVEVADYFRRVMDEDLIGAGQVRFFGGYDYVGDWATEHAFTSRLTGETTAVRVRKRFVDATYLETSVPATHTPSFSVGEGATMIPVGELVHVTEAPAGFTILGSGKTAVDACCWLLDNGVDPDRVRWVRPRDPWLMNRATFQPLELIGSTMEHLAATLEALAEATGVEDLFRRLEDCGELKRVDQSVQPTMFRGAIVSDFELETLRRIERVVRLGHVRHIDRDRVVLDDGDVPAAAGEIHVDCTAYGLKEVPARPIFEGDRITLQSFMGGFTTFSTAVVGFLEANRDDDAERNRLCPPTPYASRAVDWIDLFRGGFSVQNALLAEPDAGVWLATCRLNNTRGLAERMDDPVIQKALGRWFEFYEPALANADKLLATPANSRK